MIKNRGWCWFCSGQEAVLDPDKCGKWMFRFEDWQFEFAKEICQAAIDTNVCYKAKCSDLEATWWKETGVVCFYANGDDIDNHRRIINFMLENNLIRKTAGGRFYNESFKFDEQTRNGEYGVNFVGKIKLEQFINLDTGEWIYK